MDADVREFPGTLPQVESLLVAIGGAPEDGQADLAVAKIETVLAARGDADRQGAVPGGACPSRSRFFAPPARSSFDDQPSAVDMFFPVIGTKDGPAGDLGQEDRRSKRGRNGELQPALRLVPCDAAPDLDDGPGRINDGVEHDTAGTISEDRPRDRTDRSLLDNERRTRGLEPAGDLPIAAAARSPRIRRVLDDERLEEGPAGGTAGEGGQRGDEARISGRRDGRAEKPRGHVPPVHVP